MSTTVVRPQRGAILPAGVDVAATDSPLHALTAAALALPGLVPTASQAVATNEAEIQYGRYEEGGRKVFESNTIHKPIQVDSLVTSAGVMLSDRLKLRFGYLQDTWSGATPITSAPVAAMAESVSGASGYVANVYNVDRELRPLVTDLITGELVQDASVIHMISSASPETRKQIDLKLGHEWDEQALDIGGGVSLEDDYESRFANANLRWDLHQKLTSINVGVSYTDSEIYSLRNPLFEDYIDYVAHENPSDDTHIIGSRRDAAAFLGLTQVLNKKSVFETGIGFTRSTGFQENAYKVAVMAFVDPAQEPGPAGELQATAVGVLEDRPDTRDQWTWTLGYVRYVESTDAALHLDYRLYQDSWEIDAHTLEAAWVQPLGAGWTLTPRARFYTQDSASFYRPYFVFNQAAPRPSDADPLDLSQIPVTDFSSDYRLSSYGAFSSGLTVSKEFGSSGTRLEAGIEYYKHSASWGMSGGDDADYSNYSALIFNLGLRMDLSAPASLGGGGGAAASTEHAAHAHGGHAGHSGPRAPAGVMGDHMLSTPGDVMVGYRYMYSRQGGDMLRGSQVVSDDTVVNNGCGDTACTIAPAKMNMHMHMLDIMYAATERLNFMIMPMLMDMNMKSRMIGDNEGGGGHSAHAAGHEHASGGVGDTGVFALVKLWDRPGHHLNLGLGVNVPTGSVEQKARVQYHDEETGDMYSVDEYVHYGMQLGTGAWDFRPSLTYTGSHQRWGWGVQLSSVHHLEQENSAGFSFGDVFQSTAWASYGVSDWLSASVRAAHLAQSSVTGEYNGPHAESSPADLPYNYGGRFTDVGVGLTATATDGDLKGNSLGIEWLVPVSDFVYGYQQERKGTLFASWSIAF